MHVRIARGDAPSNDDVDDITVNHVVVGVVDRLIDKYHYYIFVGALKCQNRVARCVDLEFMRDFASVKKNHT